MPKRPDELRELAALAQQEADHLRALADLHERRQRLTAGQLPLPEERAIIRNMAQAALTDMEPRRRGRPLVSDHPFPAALEASDQTIASWAKKNKLRREHVKSWYAPKAAGGRRIPYRWAKLIERELNVPATEDVWRNGIR